MHIRKHIGALRFAEKGDHRHHDQQGFQPLAQEDRERAHEARRVAGLIGRKGASGVGEQSVQCLDLASHFGDGRVSADRAAHLAHGRFDAQHEGVVARRQRRFDRLEAVEIGGEREIGRLALVARLIGRQTFAELLTCDVE